jgi:general secretion pathway protein I
MRGSVPPYRVGGFTLLEAIVALVVFSVGALALYGWLSANILSLERVRDRQQVEAAVHSALDLVRRTNPMDAPGGKRQLSGLEVNWISTLIEPMRSNVDQSGSPGIFLVGLYETRVRLTRDGQELREFRVRQVGWKKVRSAEEL